MCSIKRTMTSATGPTREVNIRRLIQIISVGIRAGRRVRVLFLWHTEIRIVGDKLTYRIAPRKPTGLNPWSEAKWKASSNKFVRMVQSAYEQQLPIRAVIVDGKQFDAKTNPNASKVEFRKLDEMSWAVDNFDPGTMEGLLIRGASPVHPNTASVDTELTAFEGWRRRAFIWHRHRESELRRAKIKEVMDKNGGRLVCEVPRCGFDFGRRYGEVGEGYAHVHHLEPLSKTPKGRTVSLHDLAVVCANCHAMIHRGGQCRVLTDLIS
jgi:5-methylcytosine-specific restriction protein A